MFFELPLFFCIFCLFCLFGFVVVVVIVVGVEENMLMKLREKKRETEEMNHKN